MSLIIKSHGIGAIKELVDSLSTTYETSIQTSCPILHQAWNCKDKESLEEFLISNGISPVVPRPVAPDLEIERSNYSKKMKEYRQALADYNASECTFKLFVDLWGMFGGKTKVLMTTPEPTMEFLLNEINSLKLRVLVLESGVKTKEVPAAEHNLDLPDEEEMIKYVIENGLPQNKRFASSLVQHKELKKKKGLKEELTNNQLENLKRTYIQIAFGSIN